MANTAEYTVVPSLSDRIRPLTYTSLCHRQVGCVRHINNNANTKLYLCYLIATEDSLFDYLNYTFRSLENTSGKPRLQWSFGKVIHVWI